MRPLGDDDLASHPEVYPAPIGMVGRYSVKVMRNWGHFEWLDTYLRKDAGSSGRAAFVSTTLPLPSAQSADFSMRNPRTWVAALTTPRRDTRQVV